MAEFDPDVDGTPSTVKAFLFLSNGSEVDTAGELRIAQEHLGDGITGWPLKVTWKEHEFIYNTLLSEQKREPCYCAV